MPVAPSRVDLLLQYALLVAGEQDEFLDRQLGPIHLIKYVYLADLFHAKRNNGVTFTGTGWQFYKFGPWSQSVYARIEPALSAIDAERRSFESNYEEKQDWVRWSLSDEEQLEEIGNQLSFAITSGLKEDVRRFGQDTQSLLHHVYRTEPMLSAAPNELLDFTVVAQDISMNKPVPTPLRMDGLSAKKKKQFKERMRALRARYKNRERKDHKLINPVKDARYDDAYVEGMNWLDSLAGEPLREGEHIVQFSDDVWKSATRKGEDVS